MRTKILITAVNSPPGRAAYSSLKINKKLDILSIDADKNSVFKFLDVKNFSICPRANTKDYKKFIDKFLKKKNNKDYNSLH